MNARTAIFASVLALALALAVLIGAPDAIGNYRADKPFFESPAFFPRLAAVLIAIGAIGHLVSVLRGRFERATEEMDVASSRLARALAAAAIIALYIFATPRLGYALASVLAFGALMTMTPLGWPRRIAFVALSVAVLWLVFVRLLGVGLPRSPLGI